MSFMPVAGSNIGDRRSPEPSETVWNVSERISVLLPAERCRICQPPTVREMMDDKPRPPRVIFSFLSIGHYRRAPMSLIIDHFGSSLQVFAGRFATDRSIRTLGPSDLPLHTLPTYSYRDKIVFQIVPFISYLRADVLVADLNPRALHLWPILVFRRLLGKRTVLWGAAWPRSGKDSRTTQIRMAMVRLASSTIIYTNKQAEELKLAIPGARVTAAPNSLYRESECGFITGGGRSNFIYVGRIVNEKKVELLIDAFAQVAPKLPGTTLIIIGDGPALSEMRNRVDALGVAELVDFRGHVEDVDELRTAYSSCIAAVSPGYVGLSATQSFSFGVPMIIADTEPHSPEIEAVRPGFNALYFPSDSASGLAKAMERMAGERDMWNERGPDISRECCKSYSAEAMAGGVIRSVETELSF